MSVTHTAALPLGRHTVLRLATLLLAERKRRGTREGTRALTCWEQAVFALRWLCDATPVKRLCEDNEISKSAGYRHLHEAVGVLAWQAPDLRNALLAAKAAGYAHVIVDGTVVETDRVSVPGPTRGVDLWWSGKVSKQGNLQVVSAPDDGWPLWVSDVRPGREHDTTALRSCGALPVLAEWTGGGGEVLADLGYEGLAGPGRRPLQEGQGRDPPRRPEAPQSGPQRPAGRRRARELPAQDHLPGPAQRHPRPLEDR